MGDAIVIIGVLVVVAIISMRRRGATEPTRWSRPKEGAGGKQQVRQRLDFARLAVRIILALTVIFVIVPLIIWMLTD